MFIPSLFYKMYERWRKKLDFSMLCMFPEQIPSEGFNSWNVCDREIIEVPMKSNKIALYTVRWIPFSCCSEDTRQFNFLFYVCEI